MVVKVFLFGVAYKNYNVGQLCFFVRAQPKLCFGRHWGVLIYSARKTSAHLGQKTLFTTSKTEKIQSYTKFLQRELKVKMLGEKIVLLIIA